MAMETVWGLNTPGDQRGALLLKLAELIEQNKEELAALEALDNGRPSHQSCISVTNSGYQGNRICQPFRRTFRCVAPCSDTLLDGQTR